MKKMSRPISPAVLYPLPALRPTKKPCHFNRREKPAFPDATTLALRPPLPVQSFSKARFFINATGSNVPSLLLRQAPHGLKRQPAQVHEPLK